MQVASGQFRAILPGGPATKASLEVVSLAADLTETHRSARAWWSFTQEALHNFAWMMPVDDAKRADHYRGAGLACQYLLSKWMETQPDALTQDPNGILLSLSCSRSTDETWFPGHEHEPVGRPTPIWGPKTYTAAVANAEPNVAGLLQGHARANNNIVHEACTLAEMAVLVGP